jgi:multidrug efflux pump subunit AcrA (membrane-fusion protein)
MTHKTISKTLIISLAAALALSGCGNNNDKNGDAKGDKNAKAEKGKVGDRALQAVSVAPIELQDFSPRLVVAGQVQAVQEARIFPTASGARVLQILADAGDRVNAGQALARLEGRQISADSELLAAQVRRARTALAEADVGLAAARQNFARTQSGPKESGLDTRGVEAQFAEARLALARALATQKETALSTEQAEIALAQAQAEYDRALQVKGDGALSVEQLEARRAQAETAASRLRSQRVDATAIVDARRTAVSELEARASSARGDAAAFLDGRRQGVAQAQARVDAARADLQVSIAQQAQSESRQNNGIITSPVSGLIISRNVNVGEIAGGNGQPMFTIVAGNALEVAAEVSEGDLGRLTIGMRAHFTAPDGTPTFGVLRRLPAQIDPTRRTGIARFTLDGNPSVKAGVFLTGSATAANRGVAAVPASAIVYGPEGPSVFVLRADNTVRKARVVLGGRQDQLVEIVSGVPLGSIIVTSGSSLLTAGEKVNPIRVVPQAIPAIPKTAPSNSVVPPKN